MLYQVLLVNLGADSKLPPDLVCIDTVALLIGDLDQVARHNWELDQDQDLEVLQHALVDRRDLQEAGVSEDGSILVDGHDNCLMGESLEGHLVEGAVDLLEAALVFLPKEDLQASVGVPACA